MQQVARRGLLVFLLAGSFATTGSWAQQRADPNADVAVADPAFPPGKGPLILIDSAHGEFHTADGRYAPFAALLRNDGYRVEGLPAAPTPQALSEARVLVIADAVNPAERGRALSALDASSAFSDADIAALHAWVEQGGSLLIAADHPPFAGGARALAASFGFTIDRYASQPPERGHEVFKRGKGLVDGPITAGVDQVMTFFGTTFRAAPGATALLRLDSGCRIGPPRGGRKATSEDLRAAARTVGRGRVILIAEAGGMSAQRNAQDGGAMGFNAKGAEGNKRFVRNMIGWLARAGTPAAP